MSAKAAGKPWFQFNDDAETEEVSQEEFDAFNKRHGQWLARIALRFERADQREFLMMGHAVVALVGILTKARQEKEGE